MQEEAPEVDMAESYDTVLANAERVGFERAKDVILERIDAVIRYAGTESEVAGEGNGPLDAFVRAVRDATGSS